MDDIDLAILELELMIEAFRQPQYRSATLGELVAGLAHAPAVAPPAKREGRP